MSSTVRIVCISDTHSKHESMSPPPGDVLVHAGDFSDCGEQGELEQFAAWFAAQPHEHKVVIAGNHDISLHKSYYEERGAERFHRRKKCDPDICRAIFVDNPGFHYLEDSACSIAGLNFYGSAWQPEFCDWAFNLPRGPQLKEKWERIPDDTDVLITHGPPYLFGDWTEFGGRVGCPDLANEITSRVRPKVHVFGHIHEAYGACYDPVVNTMYANASSCTYHYRPTNPPLVIDVVVGEPNSGEHGATLVAPQELVRCMPEGPDKFKFVLPAPPATGAACGTCSAV